jgi:hypothetical protein
MNWITETIALSDYHSAGDADLLRTHGVRAVFSLIGASVGRTAVDLGVERHEVLPLQDGPGDDLRRFTRAVDILTELLDTTAPVLVHCHAGRSRSPAVVGGYLVRSRRWSADDALAFIDTKRTTCLGPDMRRLLHWFALAEL